MKAEDGWLIVRDDQDSVQVLSPQDGRTVLSLQNRPVVKVSGEILLAAHPVDVPENEAGRTRSGYNYDARWEIEAWNLRTKARAWFLPSDGLPALGAVVGSYVYFADARGLHRMPVPSPGADQREERQSRDVPGLEHHRRFTEIWAGHGNIYFNADGHRVYGLRADDISRGWWNYCDSTVQAIDADGIYGTGRGYGLSLLTPSGKSFWTREQTFNVDGLSRQLYGWVSAVSKDRIAAGGLLMQYLEGGRRVNVISPYLFILEKHTGREVWKKAMDVSQAVIAGEKLILHEGHRPKGSPKSSEREWRLAIYDLQTGERRWRSGRVFSSKHALPRLAAVSNRFFSLEADRIVAYR